MVRVSLQCALVCAVALVGCSKKNPLVDGPADELPDDAARDGGVPPDAENTGGGGGTGAGGATAGGPAGAGSAGTGVMAGAPPMVGVAGAAAMAGSGSLVECDDDGVCVYDDGTECFPDGTCCNDEQGWCSGVAVPIPGRPIPGSDRPVEVTDEPWEAPVELGDSGWEDSEEVLCTEHQGWVNSYAVWADSRGVFALVAGEGGGEYHFEGGGMVPPGAGPVPFPPIGNCVGEGCPSQTLYLNDGTGWEEFYEGDDNGFFFPGETRLTGVDGGEVFLYGYYEDQNGPCGLSMIEGGERTCEPVHSVEHVFVVSDSLAYGVHQGDLIVYDGSSWGPYPAALPAIQDMSRIWANDTAVYVTSWNAGTIYRVEDAQLVVQDTRTLERFLSIWGFGEDDVWAGTESGRLYHYDGQAWTQADYESTSGCRYSNAITGMWGAGGVLYFHNSHQLGRIEGGEIEIIGEWACPQQEEQPRLMSIWGRGPNDLFLAVVDERTPRQECGTAFMLHYDGSEFHQF